MSQSDSDEEEICRYCFLHRDKFDHLPMISCSCKNGVHPVCLLRWVITRNNNSTKCEVCKNIYNVMSIYVLFKILPIFKKHFNMIGIIENGELQYRLVESIINRDANTESGEENSEIIREISNNTIDEQVQEILRRNDSWSIFIDNDELNDEEIDSFKLLIMNNILHQINHIRYYFGSYNTMMRITFVHVMRLIAFWYMVISMMKDLPEIVKLIGAVWVVIYLNHFIGRGTNRSRTIRAHTRSL